MFLKIFSLEIGNILKKHNVIDTLMNSLKKVYYEIYDKYGPQGWWPLLEFNGVNPTKTGNLKGYHPLDYSYPKNEIQKFEICIGAILTQNTTWANTEKALINLEKNDFLNPQRIASCELDTLKRLIRSSGYYNQKAIRLKIFSEFFMDLKGKTPNRDELLSVKGIGPETCDSMLLYAYKIPTFVVDAYTKRFLARSDIFDGKFNYYDVKAFFEKNLERDIIIFQEFHALIVENEKRIGNKNNVKKGY